MRQGQARSRSRRLDRWNGRVSTARQVGAANAALRPLLVALADRKLGTGYATR